MRPGPDFDVVFEPGKSLRYIHKVWNGRHVFLLANLNPQVFESVVTLRGRYTLEAWDPHSGLISPRPVQRRQQEGDRVYRGPTKIVASQIGVPDFDTGQFTTATKNTMKTLRSLVTLFLLLASLGTLRSAQPNIIFILADDLGWTDTSTLRQPLLRNAEPRSTRDPGNEVHRFPRLPELPAHSRRAG